MGNAASSQANYNSLIAQGLTPDFINSNSAFNNGKYIDPQDMSKYTTAWSTQQSNKASNQTALDALPAWLKPTTQMNTVTAQGYGGYGNFSYDPNKDYATYATQANAIYSPQMANLQALSGIQTSKTEQARITTKEDFAKQMQNEIDAINNRGAFFSGGGIANQNDINTKQTAALTDITLNDQAAQSSLLAQQGQMSAEAANYIRDLVSGAQGSAYQRWLDQANLYYQEQDLKLKKKAAKKK